MKVVEIRKSDNNQKVKVKETWEDHMPVFVAFQNLKDLRMLSCRHETGSRGPSEIGG